MAHHGNTPAAWTGVTIILIGFVVGGIGLVVANMLLFWVGVALLPVGAIVGKVMQYCWSRRGDRRSLTGARSWPPRSTPVRRRRPTRSGWRRRPGRRRGARRQRAAAPARPARERQLPVLPVAAAHRHLLSRVRRPARRQRPDPRRPRGGRVEQRAVRRLSRCWCSSGRAGSPTAGGAYDERSARACSPERSSRGGLARVLGGAQPAGVPSGSRLTPYRRTPRGHD